MKGNLRRLLAIFLVLMLLSADICAIAEAVATLTLPSALQIIEEEAFAGNTSIERVSCQTAQRKSAAVRLRTAP
ncbi:MAG: hypothetical protein E7335_12120 [Clostridiales bacterium]|nr:hypothetical protein [Clostridiales bacterium]